MTSSYCPYFSQNAWKKDLCSNCFKSKSEHKQQNALTSTVTKFSTFSTIAKRKTENFQQHSDKENNKTDYLKLKQNSTTPTKSIIKKLTKTTTATTLNSNKQNKMNKVSFSKNIFEVIGFGGEWSDAESDDEHEFLNLSDEPEDITTIGTDDEASIELKRLTKSNTDYNMNNGNFLGDSEDNIKKSFAALKLGAPLVDKMGRKQTLQINVVPFGTSSAETIEQVTVVSSSTNTKSKFEMNVKELAQNENKNLTNKAQIVTTATATATNIDTSKNLPITAITTKKIVKSSASTTTSTNTTNSNSTSQFSFQLVDGKNSPPIERAMEKSLLDEISETLKQKQNETKKFENEARDSTSSQTSETSENKRLLDLKKPIARNSPITKTHIKPKINVFHKYSDTDSNCSDNDNYVSAYYDVVEAQISYENMPDDKFNAQMKEERKKLDSSQEISSNPSYISDILMSSKTRAASYNLCEGNFITSKITSDGLIVTKCSSDDNLDSTGSSFDGSSDDETLYNITRSESDSGIGINVGHDYKNVPISVEPAHHFIAEKNLNINFNNEDYEDIQVNNSTAILAKVNETKVSLKTNNEKKAAAPFSLNKCRELHGEPDGSADPDGSLENTTKTNEEVLPALPKALPPLKSPVACTSFLYNLQKQQQQQTVSLKKPNLPVKPVISPVNKPKPFHTFISKRQTTDAEKAVISQLQMNISQSNENMSAELLKEDLKLKKGRAPNPPAGQKFIESTEQQNFNLIEESTDDKKQDKFEEKSEMTMKLKTSIEDKSLSNENATKIVKGMEKIEENQIKTIFVPKSSVSSSATLTVNTKSSTGTTYMRNLIKPPSFDFENSKSVVKEKEKRDRAIINPKFRSLNTVLMQRNNVEKNLQLQSATSVLHLPDASFKVPKTLSMSEECLTASSPVSSKKLSGFFFDKKSSTTGDTVAQTPKTKTKFSIKKFLRIGASKTTDNLCKKDGIYSEICTGDEVGVVGKPRLVIIHPIDINPTTVEVVKDIRHTNTSVTSSQMIEIMNSNSPAPQIANRSIIDKNKPIRPPPPKSSEMRRKQQDNELGTPVNRKDLNCSTKTKYDNIYANLGEIRSGMAPRKPERSASMRDHDSVDSARKKRAAASASSQKSDNISISSSNGDNELTDTPMKDVVDAAINEKRSNTFERCPTNDKSNKVGTQNMNSNENIGNKSPSIKTEWGPCSLKKSVRKVNNTIDSYLKDKQDYENMYEMTKTGAASNTRGPPFRSDQDLTAGQRLISMRLHNLYSDTASISSYPRSEQGPGRLYGLNTNLANIPRTISALYCGSEVGEFDIYSPYSYCGSEAGIDAGTDLNGSVWNNPSVIKSTKTTNHLRMRKGRSVVHKNMEDNYAAVVVANYEALAQVLDQLQQSPIIPIALRSLANVMNLRFEDFTILDCGQAFVVGGKAFHAALWTSVPVTLALSADCNQLAGVGADLNKLLGGMHGVSHPVTEFSDLVPSYHLPLMPTTEATLMQATITVLPRLQLDTLQSIGNILKSKTDVMGNITSTKVSNLNNDETNNIKSPRSFDDMMTREIAFIMLQLVNGIKNLQVNAIEEMPLSLSNVVLSKDVENKEAPARLSVLQFKISDEDEPLGTLCKCAFIALTEMLPTTKITPILSNIFLQERAESLSKAKSVLEFILWGPSDVALCGSIKERELALQRWLDLERATVLHGLVRTRVELTVYDECHLMFLVRSSAKMMNDAAKMISDFEEQLQKLNTNNEQMN